MSAGRKTVAATVTPAPLTFRTKHEEGNTIGFEYDKTKPATPAALLINPGADAKVLIGAAISRAQRLQTSLEAWAVAGDTDATLSEVIEPLEPLAEEITLLLERLQWLLSNAGRQS